MCGALGKKERKGTYALEGFVVATSPSSINAKILRLGTKGHHGSAG